MFSCHRNYVLYFNKWTLDLNFVVFAAIAPLSSTTPDRQSLWLCRVIGGGSGRTCGDYRVRLIQSVRC